MVKLFSQRQRPQPDTLLYHVPQEIRRRILCAWRLIANASLEVVFKIMLEEVGDVLETKYPLTGGNDWRGGDRAAAVMRHFQNCDTEKSLDFIEACFCVGHHPGQRGVDEVNEIFRDEGIGYALTPFNESILQVGGGPRLFVQRPQIIRRDSEFAHAELVEPAIRLRSDRRFAVASAYFLQALKHYRDGDFEACLNELPKDVRERDEDHLRREEMAF